MQLENELGFEYVNHFLRLFLGFSHILHACSQAEEGGPCVGKCNCYYSVTNTKVNCS